MREEFSETELYEGALTKMEMFGERVGALMRNKTVRLVSLISLIFAVVVFGGAVMLRAILRGARNRQS